MLALRRPPYLINHREYESLRSVFFFFYVDKKQERIKTYSKNSLLKEYINIYFNEYIPIKIKSLFIIKDTELDWLSELLLIT